MKVIIYADDEKEYNDFKTAINKDAFNFELSFVPIENDVLNNKDPHFSIFLLKVHYANNQFLHEKIRQLKKQGAHDQNFLFIIIDKENAKTDELQMVKADLFNSLSFFIKNPLIYEISLKGFKVALSHEQGSEYSFIFKDSRSNEFRDIQQVTSEEDRRYLSSYIGMEEVLVFLETNWMKGEYLLLWTPEGHTNILYQYLPYSLIEEMKNIKNLSLCQIKNQMEFNKLGEDSKLITITTVQSESLEKNDVKPKWLLIDNEGQNMYVDTVAEKYFYINSRLFEKRNNSHEELIMDEDVFVLNEMGFPKPKTNVKDWHSALSKASGFKEFLTSIE
ncbi:hypothetical protein [Marinococcus luteus]|uniref:hypothetical protein n=1 Tax=Marinococcus luteus TaxID=1122204 RepID=UPI002ACCD884|nr:hypothetical protein [Marinococcus luteus]MDZ5783376.1 hypothetical protein [Marinococcus luteus]